MDENLGRSSFKQRLDEMVNTLRGEIITRKRKVGDFLPSETDIAKRFNLSKHSVRKGLDILVSEGLIVKKSRVGNVVASHRPEEIVTLNVGYYPSLISEMVFFDLVSQFEESHPSIKIQPLTLPYGNYKDFVKNCFSNDMLDVVTINYNDFCEFSTTIGDYFDTVESQDDVYPFLEDAFKESGNLYVRPLIYSPVILCYNKDHFTKSGIEEPDSSWNWNKVIEVANQISATHGQGSSGFYFHPLSLNRWPVFLLQELPFSRQRNNKIDKEALINGLTVGKEIFEQQTLALNVLSDSDKDAEGLFTEERVSMILTTYLGLNNIRECGFNYDIAPLPYSSVPATLLIIIGLAINKHSRKKEAAKKFIQFMSSQDTCDTIRSQTLSIPALKKRGNSLKDNCGKPDHFELYRDIIPTYKLYTDIGLSFSQLVELKQEIRLYWSGLMPKEELSQRLEKFFVPDFPTVVKNF